MSREEFTKRYESMDKMMQGIVLLMVKHLRFAADELIYKKVGDNWAGWDK